MNYTPLELFRMYQGCERMQLNHLISRNDGNYGIAVDNDYHARAWQKYHILQYKIEVCLIQLLDENNPRYTPTTASE